MSETTDDTFEIVTDADTIWSVDHEGNTYSYQLTEAERLQDSAHSEGSGHDEAPYGDKDGGDAHKTGARELHEDDSDMVTAYDTDDSILVDSDGNTYSFQLTEAEAERLPDAAYSEGSGYDEAPYGDKDGGDAHKTGARELHEDDSDMVTAYDTDDSILVDSDGNTYSFQLTEAEAERLPDAAYSEGSGYDDVLGGADMAMAALMDVQFLDLVF